MGGEERKEKIMGKNRKKRIGMYRERGMIERWNK
jgi:hypothetical protein